MLIQCKRVYFPAEKDDGYRVLVDRLWPRGIKKRRWSMMNGIRPLRLPLNCAKPFIAK
ncbi:Uncharacterized conserved protein [Salmonella enterica subsp. arizonae]|uniref:Uncharacterized conserved protein n=1 Tax=Salmonella enterica subsp. arizonae TaxID=59203 RepID=A0A447R5K6_SALER|nr:Uncharacterized conserved protein [Salmonella enterica subsp. arizonae]